MSRHQLDSYQRAAFQCGIVRRNVGKEKVDLVLETAMEYAGALRTIVFNESCCLHDLTEAQVGRNQFAVDVVVDCLDERIDEVDGRADHASKQLSVLEGKVMDMEDRYQVLLALGQEQVETSVQACQAIGCHRHGRLARLLLDYFFKFC